MCTLMMFGSRQLHTITQYFTLPHIQLSGRSPADSGWIFAKSARVHKRTIYGTHLRLELGLRLGLGLGFMLVFQGH